MARAYYCLVAGFPDLGLDDPKLPFSLASLRADLTELLAPADRVYLESLFWPVDLKNLLAVLSNRPEHDPQGNFSREILEEEVKVPMILPAWAREAIDLYRAGLPSDRYPENLFSERMHDELAKSSNSFVRNWFEFERDLRNLIAALGCRKTGADPEQEIVGEGLVAEAARRMSGADFGLTRELTWLEGLLRSWDQGLLERELALDRIRLDVMDELTIKSGFSVDRVLAFVLRLSIAERWLGLDATTGREMLKDLLGEMESGLVFPDEFSLHGGRKYGDNR